MTLLTAHRLQRGWTKAELSRRSGLHATQVGAIESGRLIPYASQLKKLATAFGLPEADADQLMREAAQQEIVPAPS